MDKKRRLLEAWKALADELQESGDYTLDDLIAELRREDDAIPLTAFGHGMTPLEAATRYLAHTGKDSGAIAKALGRNRSSIERSLAHGQSVARTVAYAPSSVFVPSSVFAGETPASEALCTHLKLLGMTNKQIADALGLDQRTVWTLLDRAKRRGGEQ